MRLVRTARFVRVLSQYVPVLCGSHLKSSTTSLSRRSTGQVAVLAHAFKTHVGCRRNGEYWHFPGTAPSRSRRRISGRLLPRGAAVHLEQTPRVRAHHKAPTGESFAVEMAPTAQIKDLKGTIYAETGLLPQWQHLALIGREDGLPDAAVLSETVSSGDIVFPVVLAGAGLFHHQRGHHCNAHGKCWLLPEQRDHLRRKLARRRHHATVHGRQALLGLANNQNQPGRLVPRGWKSRS